MNSSRNQNNETDLASHIGRGAAAFEAGDFVQAISHFKKSVEADNSNARLWNDLGQAYKAVNQLGNAATCYDRAAKLNPHLAEPLNNLGVLCRLANELEEAESYYNAALQRRPEYPEAHYNLALVMEERGNVALTEKHYREAISLRPGYIRALNNLGVLMISGGRLDEAEEVLRGAILVHASSPELLTSLGTCMRHKGELGEAAGAYRKAIAARPQFSEASWNLALVDLAEGRYRDGWKNYLYRPSVDRELYPIPRNILGEDLTGKSFNVYGEQGLGDELFFLRFLPLLAARGGQIQYHSDPRIKDICTRSIGGQLTTEMYSQGEKLSVADLPFLLGSREPLPSLKISPLDDKLKAMEGVLSQAGPPPYIGLTYRAGLNQIGSHFKEVPLSDFGAALRRVGGTIINIQRLPDDGEREVLEAVVGRPVLDLTAFNQDLEDMLALMDTLDDYVGVSNANMHLRAAVAKPARVLVSHPAEYRWMSGGLSPWFPEFKLYRQSLTGDWISALSALSHDLTNE